MRPVRLITSLLSVLAVLGIILLPQAQAAGGQGMTWNLASDFRVAPDEANPNPDQYGNPDVWYFMAGRGLIPASFKLLPGFISNACDVEGIETWWFGPRVDKIPSVGINATGSTQDACGFVWPAGVIEVHPYTMAVVVGWHSPIAGTLNVSLTLSDMNPDCGNGVIWAIRKGAESPLAFGVMPNGGAANFDGTVSVQEGDFLICDRGPLLPGLLVRLDRGGRGHHPTVGGASLAYGDGP